MKTSPYHHLSKVHPPGRWNWLCSQKAPFSAVLSQTLPTKLLLCDFSHAMELPASFTYLHCILGWIDIGSYVGFSTLNEVSPLGKSWGNLQTFLSSVLKPFAMAPDLGASQLPLPHGILCSLLRAVGGKAGLLDLPRRPR